MKLLELRVKSVWAGRNRQFVYATLAYLWRVLQQDGDMGTIHAGCQRQGYQAAATLQTGLQRAC